MKIVDNSENVDKVDKIDNVDNVQIFDNVDSVDIVDNVDPLLPKRLKNPKEITGSKMVPFFLSNYLTCHHKKLKIGQRGNFEKIEFFSLFLMRKQLSSGQ